MKIGVMGAGAVGCYYGAMLARAGFEVTLVGRAPFVERVRADGLRVSASAFDTVVEVQATTEPKALASSDFVLFCVKSADTEAAGRLLAPVLRPDCAVLSFQNGVDNPERLAPVLGRPVVPAALYVGVEMVATAHVRHLGRGEIIMGEFPASAPVLAAFAEAGIPAEASAQARIAQWHKFLTNCAYNALSAVAGLRYGALLKVTGVDRVMTDVVTEAVAVAHALGIAVQLDMQPILSLADTMPNQWSSTAQDLMRGKPTEIEYLNGYVVRKGAELGVATPANAVLLALVRARELAAERI